MGYSRSIFYVVGVKIPSNEKMRIETILLMKDIPYKVESYNESSFIVLQKEEFNLHYSEEFILSEISNVEKEKFKRVLHEAKLDDDLQFYLIYDVSH